MHYVHICYAIITLLNKSVSVYKFIYSVLLVLELITKTKCLVSESVAADTSNTLASCEHEGKPTRAQKADSQKL